MVYPETKNRLVEALDEWLPQTQCTQCGYPRCLDYARAVAEGDADINQCPPGGDITIQGLAALLQRAPKPLNTDFGVHRPRTVVRIDEPRCIGCTLCIQVCPVDAIAGAGKQMHTVIEDECTGCDLCLPACPVDCIDVLPTSSNKSVATRWPEYTPEQTARAKLRTRARLDRLERRERTLRLDKLHNEARRGVLKEKITAAVSRVRERRRSGRHAGHE